MKQHRRFYLELFEPLFYLMVLTTVVSWDRCVASNLLINGSFEQPAIGAPNTFEYRLNNELTAWTIVTTHTGAVQFNTGYHPVSESAQAVQLETAGDTLSQSFATVPGGNYRLSFDLSAYDSGGGAVGVTVGSASATFNGNSSAYSQQTLDFTATSTTTTLAIANTGVEHVSYPHIDNVSVVEMSPELQINPTSTNVLQGASVAFSASGGAPPYAYTVAANNSGGSVTSGGLYTAGYIAGTDTVLVTDSLGSNAVATVNVSVVPLAIQPATANVNVATGVAFVASGGKPPYSFALTANNSGGAINPSDGLYTSGSSAGTDIIQVMDDLGSNALATVTVTVPLQTSQLLVDIDATGLAPGTLTSITNKGSAGGFFYARGGGTTVPVVAAVDGGGTRGIRFDGDDYLQHVVSVGGALVAAPAGLVGVNPTCTIEAWVLNGAIDQEEFIVAWGKRGGPSDLNMSFNYGWDAGYGAVSHWSAADMGWTSGTDGGGVYGVNVPSAGVWHHLVYTFDGTTQRVYADGIQKNIEVVSMNIASGTPVTIAAALESNGTTVTPTHRGSLTIGRLRIHDGALTAAQVATNYFLEASAFTNGPGAQLLSGPAHRYQFNNTAGAAPAGSIVQDLAGIANGTVLGSGATFSGSRLTLPGGASGTAAYVDLPDGLLSVNSTNKGGSGEVTIEGWARVTGNRTWSRIFDFGSSSGGSGQDYLFYSAQVNTDVYTHRLEVRNVDAVGGTGGGGTTDHGSTTYGANLHFAITWNDATGEMRVYENGEFVIRRTETARLTQLNDVNVWLGRSQFTSDQNLQGEFDEFRIYNRVLSDAELRGNFLRGPGNVLAQLATFTVTGGGSGCGGAPVGLSGSEVGVTYLLRTNSVYAGVALGGTGTALSFGNQAANGTYSVLASNTTSAATALMSGSLAVSVVVPPAITLGPTPSNLTNYQGGYLSFALTATGSPLNYQWRRDGTNLVNGGSISGVTSNRLTIYPANPTDSAGPGHGYVCVVSNSCLTVASTEATATIIPFVAVPETVSVAWTNHHWGTNGGDPRSVLVDNQGNIIVTGHSDGATPDSVRVTAIKYSSSGIPLWTNDNSGPLDAQGYNPKAALDGNGNLIIVKTTGQIIVDKYSGTNGLLLWEKSFGSSGAIGVAVDANGDVVVAGSGNDNYSYAAKFAGGDGSIIWQTNRQVYYGGWGSVGFAVAVGPGGHFIVAGNGTPLIPGVGQDVFITKYDGATGAVLWDKRYGKPSGVGEELMRAMAIGASGNIVTSGFIGYGNNSQDIFAAKFAWTDGSLLWETFYNVGPGTTTEEANACALDVDENVFVTGDTGGDYCTAKFAAADGRLLWDKRYNGPNNRGDYGTAIAVDGNGDAVVTGLSGTDADPNTGNSKLTEDIQTIKYSGKNGAQLWSARFNGLANRDDRPAFFENPLAITPAGEVVVVGATDGGFVIPVPYPSHWVTIKYAAAAPNARPVVQNPIPDANGIYGTPFNFTFAANTFSDPDAGQTLSYGVSSLPAGIIFTPATRTFSGTATAVGTASVTVTATDNGSPALSTNDVFDIVIAKAPLTATADNKSRTYAETNPLLTFSYSSFVLGENASVLDTPPIASTLATNGSPVGPYPIAIGGGADDHYELGYVNGTLNINPAPLTVTADNTNRVYGELNPAFTGTVIGVANGDNITASYGTTADTNSPPGTYAITPGLVDPDTKLGNYAVTTNVGTLTVTAAPLTVTANDTNRVYGTANPDFTGLLVGVVNGDNITATFITVATITDPPGTYPITPELTDPDGKLINYVTTTNNGTLTIMSPPELTFTLGGGGGGLFTLSWPASYSGFVLEVAESLTPPIDWQPVTSGITESGGIKSYSVTNDPNVPGRLYRLRLP